jgi:hypothetical protein
VIGGNNIDPSVTPIGSPPPPSHSPIRSPPAPPPVDRLGRCRLLDRRAQPRRCCYRYCAGARCSSEHQQHRCEYHAVLTHLLPPCRLMLWKKHILSLNACPSVSRTLPAGFHRAVPPRPSARHRAWAGSRSSTTVLG